MGASLTLLLGCGNDTRGGDAPPASCGAEFGCPDLGSDGGESPAGDGGLGVGAPSGDVQIAPEDMGPSAVDGSGVCEIDETDCTEDRRARVVCDPDQRRLVQVPCAEEEYCADGACVARICSPNEQVCDGQILRTCDELGGAYVDGADQDCAALDRDCLEGQCVDAVEASRGATCADVDCMTARTRALICGRYATDILETTPDPFEPGPVGQCDPGTLTGEAYDEALRVVNYARWLTGLAEVGYDDSLNPRTQACALIMANQRALSHDPPPNWACYTPEGAQAAGESNIHYSTRAETIVESVIGYLHDGGDNNRADVGHRRWLQSATLGRVGFGYHHSQTTRASASCYNVIASDPGPPSGPPFIAYPNPGVFPIELLTSRFWTLPWSVSISAGFRDELAPTADWTVQVWRVDGDEMTPLPVNHVNASGLWYGRNHAVVFSPNFEVIPGEYRVLVEGPAHRFEWTSELVSCGR